MALEKGDVRIAGTIEAQAQALRVVAPTKEAYDALWAGLREEALAAIQTVQRALASYSAGEEFNLGAEIGGAYLRAMQATVQKISENIVKVMPDPLMDAAYLQ